MRHAPHTPSTHELHAKHPMGWHSAIGITTTRQRIGDVLNAPGSGLLAIVGACALTDNLPQLRREAADLRALEADLPGLVTAQRLNTWKPRTSPADWHGMETVPDTVARAHQIVTSQAVTNGNAAMELGYPGHIERHRRALTLGWIGARAAAAHPDEAQALLEAAAACTEIPLGIKNGQDGNIGSALARVAAVNKVRGAQAGAPAFLLYRGGANAKTPETWAEQYKLAWGLTDGHLVVDCAHDTMRAHTRGNGKSIAGQMAAVEHVIELSAAGYAPAGVMMEASDTESVVDPNMPHSVALDALAQLCAIKMNALSVSA